MEQNASFSAATWMEVTEQLPSNRPKSDQPMMLTGIVRLSSEVQSAKTPRAELK